MNSKLMITMFIFLLGLIFCLTYNNKYVMEGFKSKPRCANTLIQKGDKIELLNTNLAKIPGVNPLTFNNLEEYVEFTEWQRSQGINCPALYLQQQYNTQGELDIYQMNGNPTNPEYGKSQWAPSAPGETPPGQVMAPQQLLVDSNRNDDPYNTNTYPGFDAHNQYEGTYTPLDKIYTESEKNMPRSPNAMDTNWGGESFSQTFVENTRPIPAEKKINPWKSQLLQNGGPSKLALTENGWDNNNNNINENEQLINKSKKVAEKDKALQSN